MAKEKMMMPQGSAGLIRYFEATKESIKLSPGHVAGICAALIVFELAIKFIF
jgi:preprotein translocase subunit Sec61beta